MAAKTEVEKKLLKALELLVEVRELLGSLNADSFKAPDNKEVHHLMFYAYEKMKQSSRDIHSALERERDYRTQQGQ